MPTAPRIRAVDAIRPQAYPAPVAARILIIGKLIIGSSGTGSRGI